MVPAASPSPAYGGSSLLATLMANIQTELAHFPTGEGREGTGTAGAEHPGAAQPGPCRWPLQAAGLLKAAWKPAEGAPVRQRAAAGWHRWAWAFQLAENERRGPASNAGAACLSAAGPSCSRAGPAMDSPFWLNMAVFHLGLFACM